jgi:hypothetical protein
MKTFTAIVVLVSFAVVLSGCATTVVPVKGTYVDKPFEISTEKSKEEVWNKVVDFISVRGIGIKTIDKASGLLVTNMMSFVDSYSYENWDTTLANPGAFVVCDKPMWGSMLEKPDKISGNWYIHVVESEGRVLVTVILANLEVGYPGDSSPSVRPKSTGKFEGMIADAVK